MKKSSKNENVDKQIPSCLKMFFVLFFFSISAVSNFINLKNQLAQLY